MNETLVGLVCLLLGGAAERGSERDMLAPKPRPSSLEGHAFSDVHLWGPVS